MINIIIHEVAHAVVGCEHGHNKKWKDKCIEMGGTGKRSEAPLARKKGAKYKSSCSKCGTSYLWVRKGKHKCCGKPMKVLKYEDKNNK